MTTRLERAARWSAACHEGQTRRGGDVPYFTHVAAVALVLARFGFDEDTTIAGLLHDVVEDTPATIEDVAARFGPVVAETVRWCSEIKHDHEGRKRPWIDRKRDHLAALAVAPARARAVVLADKLHNLITIELDLDEGRPVWSLFHAEREQALWYYRETIEVCSRGEPSLNALAGECREALQRVEALGARGRIVGQPGDQGHLQGGPIERAPGLGPEGA